MTVQNIVLPGQYYDQETGLHYNYFRDYDPNIGRYIESDPIGLSGGINVYTYVENNSIVESDKKGLLELIDPNSPKHLNRNKNNRCPAIEPTNLIDCKGNVWQTDNILGEFAFHGGWLGYSSYRRSDPSTLFSGFQCTYSNGNLVTTGKYRGTYDYIRPDVSGPGHTEFDVVPHGVNSNYKDPDETEIYDCINCNK